MEMLIDDDAEHTAPDLQPMKTRPLWTDQFRPPEQLPCCEEPPSRVDVAIVGSGYTGLNASRVLAAAGARVAVLDRQTIGWGASSRNGGMATPGLKEPIRAIVRRYGIDKGRLFWQASLDAIDLVDQIVREERIDCDWQRRGHLALASKTSHFRHMREHVSWLDSTFGHHVEAVGPSELRTEIGSDAYHGGIVDEYSGGLQPAKYVFGLAAAVARQGVQLCERTSVQRIVRRSEHYEVFTDRGCVLANEVLVATNGYTDRLLPWLKSRIFPIGSYIITTAPLTADLQQQLSPRGRMFYTSNFLLNYFRLTADGRMLWGGRNNLRTDLDLAASADTLRTGMLGAFPDLSDVGITHSWTGPLGITFDRMPHIGRVNGVHYAVGYGGHGLSIATYLGTEVGLLMTGAKASSPFSEIAHPTMPLYRDRPWFVPLAALYYRVRDRLS